MRIQKDLLEIPNCGISGPILQCFAAHIKPWWKYFFPHLKLHSREQQHGRGGKKEILPLLEEWKQRTHATYGDLLDILNSLYLLPPPTFYPEQNISQIITNHSIHLPASDSKYLLLRHNLVNPVCFLPKEFSQGNHFASQVLAHSEIPPMHTEYVDWSGKEICLSDIGFSLDVPQHAVPYGDPVKISVCAFMKGPFVLPAGLEFVSPIYLMTAIPDTVFKKEVKLSLDHWARLEKDTKLFFVFAPFDIESPNQFRVHENGVFSQHSGTTIIRHFCLGAIVRKLCDFLNIPLPVVPVEQVIAVNQMVRYLNSACDVLIKFPFYLYRRVKMKLNHRKIHTITWHHFFIHCSHVHM